MNRLFSVLPGYYWHNLMKSETLWTRLSLVWIAMIALAFLCLTLGAARAFLYLAVAGLG